MFQPDSVRKGTKLRNCVDYTVRTEFTRFSVIIELSPLPLLKFALMLSLISKLMVTYLDGRMVNTHNVQNGAENSQGNGNPPPPPSLAQAIASIFESRDEQTELLRQLIAKCTTSSSEGGYCEDWPHQLHYPGRCSRGRTGPR
jgi:hypothetical protein